MAKVFYVVPKWGNFAKSGHTVDGRTGNVTNFRRRETYLKPHFKMPIANHERAFCHKPMAFDKDIFLLPSACDKVLLLPTFT